MERSYYFSLIILLISISNLLEAKPPVDKYRCLFFDSYVKGDMQNWPGWIGEMNQLYEDEPEGQVVSLQAQYGLIGYYFGTRQKKNAREWIRSADDQLDELLEKHPNDARLHSLKAAFSAFSLGLAIYKAPILGPRIEKSIQQAFKLNPEEPSYWLENGNSLYNRPEIFGGDKHKAIESYKRSLQLFNTDKKPCNYLKVLVEVFILKGYYETNQFDKYKQFRQDLEGKYDTMNWLDEFLQVEFME